jgi:GntR family transcriptional regulator, transcriptional repressor for pyruvate dehydrogenase complex
VTPQAIRPVRRLKLSDSVAAQLEHLIRNGEYGVGLRLPAERELADQFGVGRSTMREALSMLQTAGLLRIEHGIGVFVKSTSTQPTAAQLLMVENYTIPELFEVRRALEGEAASNAAKRATPTAAAALEAIVERAEDESLTDAEFIGLDAELHRSIILATKNKLLRQLFDGVEPLFLTYSHQVIGLTGRRQEAHHGHKEIVEAIVDRRPREARAAILRHLRAVERDIVEYLGQAGLGERQAGDDA